MAVSTTGRRLLCILCSVCVLSKMLKLCGAEGSSFRWLMGAVSCFCWGPSNFVWSGSHCWAASCLCGGAPDRSLYVVVRFDWCVQWLGSIRFLFLRWSRFWGSVSDTVNFVEAALVQQLGVRSLDAVNFCVGGSASWCFHQTHWLLGFVRVVGNECPLLRFVHQTLFLKWISLQCWVFWDEACQMVSLQWLEPFDACQWLVVSDRCLITYSFCWDPSAFRFLRWISLLGNVLFLAICHWHWYHSLFVTFVRFLGSLMAQGSVWVSASAVEFLKQHLVFVTMS